MVGSILTWERSYLMEPIKEHIVILSAYGNFNMLYQHTYLKGIVEPKLVYKTFEHNSVKSVSENGIRLICSSEENEVISSLIKHFRSYCFKEFEPTTIVISD